jgi:hypothetical protein
MGQIMHKENDTDLYSDLLWIDYWANALWIELPSSNHDFATTDDTTVVFLQNDVVEKV